MAKLHPQLLKDCKIIGRFELCHVLLMLDANYPWCLLVPDVDNVKEIFELSETEQQLLNKESVCLAKSLSRLFSADKMNIAAIGNMVPQLHVHHVVRSQDDIAWPKPVWGTYPKKVYTEVALADTVEKITSMLQKYCGTFTATNE
jgi:diadenosine tetraphosphate (Ap4A) HIT family hydrolase